MSVKIQENKDWNNKQKMWWCSDCGVKIQENKDWNFREMG